MPFEFEKVLIRESNAQTMTLVRYARAERWTTRQPVRQSGGRKTTSWMLRSQFSHWFGEKRTAESAAAKHHRLAADARTVLRSSHTNWTNVATAAVHDSAMGTRVSQPVKRAAPHMSSFGTTIRLSLCCANNWRQLKRPSTKYSLKSRPGISQSSQTGTLTQDWTINTASRSGGKKAAKISPRLHSTGLWKGCFIVRAGASREATAVRLTLRCGPKAPGQEESGDRCVCNLPC